MTEFDAPDPVEDPVRSAPLEKADPPGLSMRAARPPAVRLRKSVVQVLVIGGAVLVSGSLTWAFVIQPDLRASARERAAAGREDEIHGAVRPTEVVTDQPASYDRLPEPRRPADTPAPDDAAKSAAPAPAARPVSYVSRETPQAPSGPSDRQLAVRSGLFFGDLASRQLAPSSAAVSGGRKVGASTQDASSVYNSHSLTAPLSPYELKAGAVVPAVLLTGVDTAREGPVVATVSQNVFDTVSGRHLLIPQGARLIGRHEGESSYGDRRAFLKWERLILPNGKSLILSEEPGVDAQGAVGVRGQVDRRLFPLLAGTLFAGAITTLGQIARDDGGNSRSLIGDVGDAAAIEGSQIGGRLVDRELQVRPSIRLQAGAPVRVMITRDLILEPYRP